MKKTTVSLLGVAAVVICGCNSSERPFKEKFIDLTIVEIPTIQAEKEELPVENMAAMGLTDVRILSDSLAVFSKTPAAKHLTLFNYRTCETVTQLLSVGRGPGEAIDADYIGVSENGDEFWSKDYGLNTLNVFNLHNVLEGDTESSSIRFDNIDNEYNYFRVGDFLYTSPTSSCATGRFSCYDGQGHFVRYFGEFPKLKGLEDTPQDAFPAVFGGVECYDYVNNRIIAGSSFISLITVYDIDGKIIHRIWGPEPVYPSFRFVKEDQSLGDGLTISGGSVGWVEPTDVYFSIRSYDGYIYALYWGSETLWENGAILVFDAEGHAVTAVGLPEKLIGFDILPQEGLIFGINTNYDLCKFTYDGSILNVVM